MVDKEAFEAWRDNLVTQEFMRVVEFLSFDAEEAWHAHSWEGGQADEAFLRECRGRAANARYIVDMVFEDFEALFKDMTGEADAE